MRRGAEGRRATAASKLRGERAYGLQRGSRPQGYGTKSGNVPPRMLSSLPLFLLPSLLSPLSFSLLRNPQRDLQEPSPTDGSWGNTVPNPFHLPCPCPRPHRAPGEGRPTRPSEGWRGGRKEVLGMSSRERRTPLLSCTFLCHLRSGEQEKQRGREGKRPPLNLCVKEQPSFCFGKVSERIFAPF